MALTTLAAWAVVLAMEKLWMSVLRKTMALLRITSDILDPNEITKQLRCVPTEFQVMGDTLIGKRTGQVRRARFGMWSLRAPAQEPGNLDMQIAWILAATTHDLDAWRVISERHEVNMFCGLFMGQWNDGQSISSASLHALGSRHIRLDLDIYGAADDEEASSVGDINRAP